MRSSHNLVKNDTVCLCEWTPNEQMVLEEELMRMQQAGQKFNDISSILKISGRFPSKSIQQITSRIKWCQIQPMNRPSWEEYCQNESFYTAKIEQQPQTSMMFFSPRQRTTSTGSKDIFMPMANKQENSFGQRKRSYSIQGEMSEDYSPRNTSNSVCGELSQHYQPNATPQSIHKSSSAAILIGTHSHNTPRIYRTHSPATYSVVPNLMSSINQLSQDNERIMMSLEQQFQNQIRQNPNSSHLFDLNALVSLINNFNQILNLSSSISTVPLPFFSGLLELPNEAKTVNPFIQTQTGLRLSTDQQTQILPCNSLSSVTPNNGSIQVSQ
ncbi:Myb-like domain-containing protein [Entamoeba marina]